VTLLETRLASSSQSGIRSPTTPTERWPRPSASPRSATRGWPSSTSIATSAAGRCRGRTSSVRSKPSSAEKADMAGIGHKQVGRWRRMFRKLISNPEIESYLRGNSTSRSSRSVETSRGQSGGSRATGRPRNRMRSWLPYHHRQYQVVSLGLSDPTKSYGPLHRIVRRRQLLRG